ncbi:MAG: citrate/2-methylcitrate synthase [Parachlamydiales bacterium]|nr:citrate/2-methylcitrate synthase [Parachlamydiales bacterium]
MQDLCENNVNLSHLFNISQRGKDLLLEIKKNVNDLIIFDPGLYHTATCTSKICRVDKTDGMLYYRGIPIEEKIKFDFTDIAYELIFENQNDKDKNRFKDLIFKNFVLLPEMKTLLDSIPIQIHPMDFLAIGVISLESLEKQYLDDPNNIIEKFAYIIAQVSVISTYYYVRLNNKKWDEKLEGKSFAYEILYKMHSNQDKNKLLKLADILNKILIIHAEHNQNCSASTVRNIASARGNIYTAISSGIAAFKGKIHGGASQYVSEMYEEILKNEIDVNEYIDNKIKNKELIMGFGQRTYNRIYNCWDPRVEIMYKVLISKDSDFKEIEQYKNLALKLIERITKDDFFQKRNLTPNPDLFNCIFYQLFEVPHQMNPVMISLGRVAGWISNYIEHVNDKYPLTRPCDLE